MKPYDVLIIGGGIHGVGVALDAAGRGLSVLLCEQGDLACGTSSASSKLIHGGLRYLEHGDFRLVRQGLQERKILLFRAPHLVHPLPFVMPWCEGGRSRGLIQMGLWIYDGLALGSGLPRSTRVTFAQNQHLMKPDISYGFKYYDCQTDDARLVVENAIAARECGAHIKTRHRFCGATRRAGVWQAQLRDDVSNEVLSIEAHCIVNAAGPWVDAVLRLGLTQDPRARTRLVKGSHLLVRRILGERQAYILPHTDGRVIFVVPYGREHALIGTTDVAFSGEPGTQKPSIEERDYLCEAVNRYFSQPISAQDIVWEYAGVRALRVGPEADPAAGSRDYMIEVEDEEGAAPCLSIIGGKLTTYRRVAETVMKKLRPYLPLMKGNWTAHGLLPGGDIGGSFSAFCHGLVKEYSWIEEAILQRYARTYGSRVHGLLSGKTTITDLGFHYGGGLYHEEVIYLKRQEWAMTVEDVLWRRTKLGLVLTPAEVAHLHCCWNSI